MTNEFLKKEFKGMNKSWVKFGLYFGYPKCCIINFCQRGFKLTKEQESVHNNTGFIPCPECSNKILKGDATLESLIENRVCQTKFPEDYFVYSPVRWLQEALENTTLSEEQVMQTIGLFEQAIDMEKEQIIHAWENGYDHGACVNEDKDKYHGNQYYKERYELPIEEDKPEVKGKIINIRANIYKKILDRK